MRSVHVLLSGEVQGVGYRWWTVRTARELGLAGWVRNLRDGRVELRAEGPPPAVARLVALCDDGPPYAIVTKVDARNVPTEGLTGFSQRPDADSPI